MIFCSPRVSDLHRFTKLAAYCTAFRRVAPRKGDFHAEEASQIFLGRIQ